MGYGVSRRIPRRLIGYGVWCQVPGGVTGTRGAWLKAEDGTRRVFIARSDAEAEAARLMNKIGNNPYRTAQFSYTVQEIFRSIEPK